MLRPHRPETITQNALMATPEQSPTPLAQRLAGEIAREGPMPFRDFMARCLYDPEHGYYAQPARAVGRRGDFYTSVSVGPVFGELLAAFTAQAWEKWGRPETFALMEQGAHDGHLMADVLEALARHHPAAAQAALPSIIEPLAARRATQEKMLAGFPVGWSEALGPLPAAPETGVFFANELLDAFPVARLRFDGAQWREQLAALDDAGHFCWKDGGPPPPEILTEIEKYRDPSAPLAAGYVTEYAPGLDEWAAQLAQALPRGTALLLDYGREAEDYFAPHRTEGTLRGYRAHQRCDDPFAAPGETDLTADVNFTHLARAAETAGFRALPAQRQAAFLTRLALPRLQAVPPPDAAWLRQFQTLTHPAHLGHSFQAIILEKPPAPTR